MSRMAQQRRPRPGLTTASVVTAGRRVIERDGLDALSMRSVAAELGTAATSLYRHVDGREDLLVAILEQVAKGLPVSVPGERPGDRLLTRFTEAHDYMARHIWVLHILIRGELVARNAFFFANACVEDFLEAGLPSDEAMSAFRSCWYLIIGELLAEHPLHPVRHPSQRDRLTAEITAAQFPALARYRTEVADGTPPSDLSRHALRALLSALLPGTSHSF
ncbi:TetR/AcrR family transcriptional regulator [Streptomyces triticirhizae]|uniref:TetR/AcrR family transcriptional regulator n=2 Tax=Streptomyces triticirhizae TaxID=2483353 RepID=A0A3M2MAZ3_9ACTN|nr:TetR/AcrR family transcriptional regulator [Streptomyces triticirhizae]